MRILQKAFGEAQGCVLAGLQDEMVKIKINGVCPHFSLKGALGAFFMSWALAFEQLLNGLQYGVMLFLMAAG